MFLLFLPSFFYDHKLYISTTEEKKEKKVGEHIVVRRERLVHWKKRERERERDTEREIQRERERERERGKEGQEQSERDRKQAYRSHLNTDSPKNSA